MNQNIKNKLKGLVVFDYEDLNCIEFNVVRLGDGNLNLTIDLGYIDMEDGAYPYEYGLSLRTTVYHDNLVDMGKHVSDFLEFGMFDNLVFIEEAFCLNIEGEEQFSFSWDDYIVDTSSILN